MWGRVHGEGLASLTSASFRSCLMSLVCWCVRRTEKRQRERQREWERERERERERVGERLKERKKEIWSKIIFITSCCFGLHYKCLAVLPFSVTKKTGVCHIKKN